MKELRSTKIKSLAEYCMPVKLQPESTTFKRGEITAMLSIS